VPRQVTYTADASGVAAVDTTIGTNGTASFSLVDAWPVVGHAVVVHEPAGGPRAGCGIVGSPDSAFAMVGAYPGSGATSLGGTLRVAYAADHDALTVDGLVTGLAPSTTGMWHVHEGEQTHPTCAQWPRRFAETCM
jgi:hypothetical protein